MASIFLRLILIVSLHFLNRSETPMNTNILDVNPKENIIIKGAKLHNLKNIDVIIPSKQVSGYNWFIRFWKV